MTGWPMAEQMDPSQLHAIEPLWASGLLDSETKRQLRASCRVVKLLCDSYVTGLCIPAERMHEALGILNVWPSVTTLDLHLSSVSGALEDLLSPSTAWPWKKLRLHVSAEAAGLQGGGSSAAALLASLLSSAAPGLTSLSLNGPGWIGSLPAQLMGLQDLSCVSLSVANASVVNIVSANDWPKVFMLS